MFVRVLERANENTIICEVGRFDGLQRIVVTVPVKALADEFSILEDSLILKGDGFSLRDAPSKLPEHIQKAAVQAAKKIAMQFVERLE